MILNNICVSKIWMRCTQYRKFAYTKQYVPEQFDQNEPHLLSNNRWGMAKYFNVSTCKLICSHGSSRRFLDLGEKEICLYSIYKNRLHHRHSRTIFRSEVKFDQQYLRGQH